MLALLGWNSGTDQEIFTMDELIQLFSLEKVSKSGARFSPEKATWFNHQYLQLKSVEELLPSFEEVLKENGIEADASLDAKVVELLKERANFVKDIFDQGQFFYIAPTSYEEKASKKAWKEDSKEILNKFIEVLNSSEFDAETLHDAMANFVTTQEIGFGKIGMPLRLSLVGALQGPDVPVIMSILGKDETIARINKAIEVLG